MGDFKFLKFADLIFRQTRLPQRQISKSKVKRLAFVSHAKLINRRHLALHGPNLSAMSFVTEQTALIKLNLRWVSPYN